jgi:inner membrane protein
MIDKSQSFFEKNAIILKVAAIAFLTLMLLIPTSMILSLVSERKSRQIEASNEISSKWGYEQRVVGPVLAVPYYTYDFDKNLKKINVTRKLAYFLPDELKIDAELNPEVRYRGIFQVAVYGSNISLKGHFSTPKFEINEKNYEVNWKGAYLTLGISDLRGIKESIKFLVNDKEVYCEPGVSLGTLIGSGVTVNFPMDSLSNINRYEFSVDLSLNGSRSISFIPIGKETKASIRSSWNNPSFDGAFLPTDRDISEDGFSANWKILELNRNFPQKWYDRDVKFDSSSFGVSLILPVETYQVTERSIKYAVLFISLTFMIFFFIEILRKLRVHPIQYILVGFGLILFYLLLLSLSEHLGFGPAYLIASSGIVIMIAGYSKSIFNSNKLALLMAGFLILLYAFLYILLQMQDYALLLGSVGLFVILALIMYLSRKIDWYAVESRKNSSED